MKLFSRRQAELKGEIKDIFIYDTIPQAFRNQVIHVLTDAIEHDPGREAFYAAIEKEFSKQVGLLRLGHPSRPIENVMDFIQKSDTKEALDIIDFILQVYWRTFKGNQYNRIAPKVIEEINYWLKYNNLGYEFISGELIPINQMHIHQEIVKPAFALISDPRFSGADEEMRKAFEHRRKGDGKNAIIEACKAFESTMKSICTIKTYTVDPRATASALIQTLKDNSYFPSYLDSHLNSLKATLESGLPTVRNRNAGHGQGEEVVSVPDAYVDYALNLLATNIVFLVKLLIP